MRNEEGVTKKYHYNWDENEGKATDLEDWQCYVEPQRKSERKGQGRLCDKKEVRLQG